MLDHSSDFCPGSLIANVLHVNHDRHDSNFNQLKRMPWGELQSVADTPGKSEYDNENDQGRVHRPHAASADRQFA
jgi:hypothetical protein